MAFVDNVDYCRLYGFCPLRLGRVDSHFLRVNGTCLMPFYDVKKPSNTTKKMATTILTISLAFLRKFSFIYNLMNCHSGPMTNHKIWQLEHQRRLQLKTENELLPLTLKSMIDTTIVLPLFLGRRPRQRLHDATKKCL